MKKTTPRTARMETIDGRIVYFVDDQPVKAGDYLAAHKLIVARERRQRRAARRAAGIRIPPPEPKRRPIYEDADDMRTSEIEALHEQYPDVASTSALSRPWHSD